MPANRAVVLEVLPRKTRTLIFDFVILIRRIGIFLLMLNGGEMLLNTKLLMILTATAGILKKPALYL